MLALAQLLISSAYSLCVACWWSWDVSIEFFLATKRDEDYERTFGGKTIAAGLTVRITPTDDLSSPPEVEVSAEVEAELVKDEVREP